MSVCLPEMELKRATITNSVSDRTTPTRCKSSLVLFGIAIIHFLFLCLTLATQHNMEVILASVSRFGLDDFDHD